ncbi:hypothetical protein GCM10009654_32020 [Streptomyces hebeiensis]|uniref:Secreted protein n=1 Tax=Streptomyces hebeiensis TaxID=229486 RepID=A0ABN1UX39_9ACTN
MSLRHVLVTAALGSAVAVGAIAVPAHAVESSGSAPTAVERSSVKLTWVDSGERFNRLAPCDTRGSWYWDNYSNVYSWDCRWSAANRNYQLWLQKG